MALYVNTNVSALNAQRQLDRTGGDLDTSFKRLSSGLQSSAANTAQRNKEISDRLQSVSYL